MNAKLLSIVCPCYNEASCVRAFAKAIRDSVPANQPYEVLFVDDGSTDETLVNIKDLAKQGEGGGGFFAMSLFQEILGRSQLCWRV